MFGCVCFIHNLSPSRGKLNSLLNVSLLDIILLKRSTNAIIHPLAKYMSVWMLFSMNLLGHLFRARIVLRMRFLHCPHLWLPLYLYQCVVDTTCIEGEKETIEVEEEQTACRSHRGLDKDDLLMYTRRKT